MAQRTLVSFGLLAAFSLLPAVQAQGLHYNYLDAGYVRADRDDPLVDSGDGWFAGLSLGGRRYQLLVEYSESELDLDLSTPGVTGETEEDRWLYGVGWHGLFGPKLDLVIDVAYVDLDFKQTINDAVLGPTVLSASDDGFRYGGGLRFLVTPRIEIEGFLRKIDLDSGADDEIFSGVVVGYFRRWGVGGRFSTADAGERIDVFVRLGASLR